VIHAFTRRDLPGSLRNRVLATALAVTVTGGALGGLAAPGLAQDDGTGASTPIPPSTCLIVPAGAGSAATPAPAASPVANEPATPAIIEPEGTPVGIASPVASPAVTFGTPVTDAATPVASPVEETADPLATEIEATITSLFGCLNERHFDTYAEITSDAWRGAMFGSQDPLPAEQFVELANTLPEADHRLVGLGAVEVIDDTTVTAEVTYVSAYQLRGAAWTFSLQEVDGLETWVLERGQPMAVTAPEGATNLAVTFGDNGYTVSPESTGGPDVVLDLSNPTADDHEALVLRLDDGVAPETLLQGGGTLPEGVTLIGQATVPAGMDGEMILTGLEPGTYTMVDLLPDETGTPHLANGMSATFTITP